MIRLVRALAFWMATAALAAGAAELDQERASWGFRRAVTLAAGPPGGPAFAALPLPPEVGARCQPDLRDVRLVDADGREVQYVLDRAVERTSVPTWSGRLADAEREPRRHSVWVVDLGAPRAFDAIHLEIRQTDFAKRVRVEASDDGAAWRVVRQNAGVFDRPWAVRVHHTTIALPERHTARYLRLTADDRRTRPVEVVGVVVSASRRVAGEQWRQAVALEPLPSGRSRSRYRLDLPAGFPFDTFELETDDPALARRVVLYEARAGATGRAESPIADGVLYRLRLDDEALAGEALALPVGRRQGGELVLEVHDGDSPPLRKIRGFVSSPATRLVFPAVAGSLTLYYGNDATRAPLYDIEILKGRLGVSPAFAVASLGPEVANPRFRRTPPLPFVASRGAALEVPRWRALRRLAIQDREDLYTLTLTAADLALVRPDLGDLRIVDESDRQVPYIVERGAAETRVTLPAERETRTGERGAGTVSRYRLAVTGGAPLPLSSLELAVREPFFSRPARLLAPAAPGSRGGERVLFAGTLTRTADTRGGAQEPIVIGLGGAPEGVLFLEITDGDNAPLSLAEVRGAVRVPRVAFKAAPGAYRLLIGNAQAEPPRYDIASLRQEVLSYSAVAVQAGASEANPAFQRAAGDYVKDVPPGLVLWGTLGAAVLALLLLTVRILRATAGKAEPP